MYDCVCVLHDEHQHNCFLYNLFYRPKKTKKFIRAQITNTNVVFLICLLLNDRVIIYSPSVFLYKTISFLTFRLLRNVNLNFYFPKGNKLFQPWMFQGSTFRPKSVFPPTLHFRKYFPLPLYANTTLALSWRFVCPFYIYCTLLTGVFNLSLIFLPFPSFFHLVSSP
jgi:hypothetical protein